MGARDNPIVGYHAVDRYYRVIGPPGERIDPAFHSKQRALEAAEGYGRGEEVLEVVALHLDGVLGVVLHDVGDIVVDGRTAKRLVAACKRRGIEVSRKAGRRIDEFVREPIYSCRQIVEG